MHTELNAHERVWYTQEHTHMHTGKCTQTCMVYTGTHTLTHCASLANCPWQSGEINANSIQWEKTTPSLKSFIHCLGGSAGSSPLYSAVSGGFSFRGFVPLVQYRGSISLTAVSLTSSQNAPALCHSPGSQRFLLFILRVALGEWIEVGMQARHSLWKAKVIRWFWKNKRPFFPQKRKYIIAGYAGPCLKS